MFLRKLAIILLPLILLGLFLSLWVTTPEPDFWRDAVFSVLGGGLLSLVPLLAGERRGGVPFRRQLFVPAAMLLILLITQGIALHNQTWLPRALANPSGGAVVIEGVLCGALFGCGIRG